MKYAIIGLISVIILAISGCFVTMSYPATVKTKTWNRSYHVELFKWVEEHDTSTWSHPSAPANSRNVSYSSYLRTRSVPHTRSITHRDSKGRSHSTTETYYTTEIDTVYRTNYEIQRWVYSHTITSQGNALQIPTWPLFQCTDTQRITTPVEIEGPNQGIYSKFGRI